ncbi:MAG: type II toxin-antitoxin system VapC family toxin [Pseudomonadota bacterium]
MIILDTNVVSELLRPAPEARVEAWLAAQDGSAVYLTTVTEAELRYGARIMAKGRRREALAAALDLILDEDFAGRILPFGREAAKIYASIAAERRAAGRPISQFDCQIAAIAQVAGATLATRNVRDFDGCGIGIVDPWGPVDAEPDGA